MIGRRLQIMVLTGLVAGLSCVCQADEAGLTASAQWSIEHGSTGTRPISPSGDILDSGRATLAALELPLFEVEELGITDESFKNPESVQSTLLKYVYPENASLVSSSALNGGQSVTSSQPGNSDNLTRDYTETDKQDRYSHGITAQIASYAITLGKQMYDVTTTFPERQEKAVEIMSQAQDQREDLQVWNGMTLGVLSSINNMVGMVAVRNATLAAEQMVTFKD